MTDYAENPEKTNGGGLVTAHPCNPPIVDQKFLSAKRQHAVITGREQRIKDIPELQRHIGMYFKTREIYAQYQKLTGRKQSKFYEQHTGENEGCQTAKEYAAL